MAFLNQDLIATAIRLYKSGAFEQATAQSTSLLVEGLEAEHCHIDILLLRRYDRS